MRPLNKYFLIKYAPTNRPEAMDILFKTIAYGLTVDVREPAQLKVTDIVVSYDELQGTSTRVSAYKWEHVKYERLNRMVFNVDSIGLDTDRITFSEMVQSPLLDKIRRVVMRSPDIQFNNYQPQRLDVLDRCLFQQ